MKRLIQSWVFSKLEELARACARETQYIEDNCLDKGDGITTSFKTNDTPPKTVSVRNGQIISVS